MQPNKPYTNNFHYNSKNLNHSSNLTQELKYIQRDIQQQKKLLEKKQLQSQFYEDMNGTGQRGGSGGTIKQTNVQPPQQRPQAVIKNNSNSPNINLADQIMNELLLQAGDKKPQQRQNQWQQQPQSQAPQQRAQNIISRNKSSHNNVYTKHNNGALEPSNQPQPVVAVNNYMSPSYQKIGNNNNNNNQFIQPQPQPPYQRQNKLIPTTMNKRQMEIQKLQNRPEQNMFSQQSNERKQHRQPLPQQQPLMSQRQKQKLKMQLGGRDNNAFNNDDQNYNRAQRGGILNIGERQHQHPRSLQKSRAVGGSYENPHHNSHNHASPPPAPIYTNPRQAQKLKLQLHQQSKPSVDFNQRATGIRAGYSSPNKQAERDSTSISKKQAYQNRYSNPFLKDEQYIKQMKQQKQKELRAALEEQKRIQQEKKLQEKKRIQEQKYSFNAYKPGDGGMGGINPQSAATPIATNQPSAPGIGPKSTSHKRIDPNGQRPTYEYPTPPGSSSQSPYISQSDRTYMLSKTAQLNEKYKKGRLHFDDYIVQVKKLAEYYKVDYKELLDKKDSMGSEGDGGKVQGTDRDRQEAPFYNQDDGSYPVDGTRREPATFAIIENERSLEHFPDSQTSLRKNYGQSPSKFPQHQYQQQPYQGNAAGGGYPVVYPPYPQQPNMYTQNLSGQGILASGSNVMGTNGNVNHGLASTGYPIPFPQNMQEHSIINQMFEQMKKMRDDYTKNVENGRALDREILLKLMMSNIQQQQQKNSGNSATNHKRNSNNMFINDTSSHSNYMSDGGEDTIQRSMSGIMNKIPLPKGYQPSFVALQSGAGTDKKTQPQTQQICQKSKKNPAPSTKKQQTLQQFFVQPYKRYKHKGFMTITDPSQSTFEIPSVSNVKVDTKNGKDTINRMFEQDLLVMKRLQRQKDVKKLRRRVDGEGNGNDDKKQVKNTKFSYAADTFNQKKSKNIGQDGKQQKFPVISGSQYEQYQNYQPRKHTKTNKAPLVLSSASDVHQSSNKQHRTYKKANNSKAGGNENNQSQKGHENQNFPDFSDQSDIKVRSPVYYSPKLNSQILEQDVYQTTQQKELYEQFYGQGNMMKKKGQQYYEEERPSQKKINSRASDSKDQMMKSPKSGKGGGSKRSKSPLSRRNQIYNSNNKNNRPDELQNQQKQGEMAQNYSPSHKHKNNMMSVISSNNAALQKYQISPKNVSSPIDINKEYSSINSNPPSQANYFSGAGATNSNINTNANTITNTITNTNAGDRFNSQRDFGTQKNYSSSNSRVNRPRTSKTQEQNHGGYQQESLETVRSQIENSQLGSNNKLTKQHNVYQQKQQQQSQQWSSQHSKSKGISYPHLQSYIHCSQTIESIQQSSSKFGGGRPSPPLQKKRSTSRKKETTIARTKFQKQSILIRPPQSTSIKGANRVSKLLSNASSSALDRSQYEESHQQRQRQGQGQEQLCQKPLKFDSHVYESQYDQSVDPLIGQSSRQQKISKLVAEQSQSQSPSKKSSSPYKKGPQISVNPPVILNSSGVVGQSINSTNKLKTLQEARNLAKQCRKQQNDSSRYEQKMSQLESFLSNKKDDSMLSGVVQAKKTEEEQHQWQQKRARGNSPNKKPSITSNNKQKNIMNLLDDLENQSYKDDFQSYREESQRY